MIKNLFFSISKANCTRPRFVLKTVFPSIDNNSSSSKVRRTMQIHTSMAKPTKDDKKFMKIALEEAQKGYDEGGIPIGAVLVSSSGEVLGQGHNMRIQNQSAILHAEISALNNAGRLPASAYKNATMYTTLSPCNMCTGAILLYGIARVVMGENKTFVGGEDWLGVKGVEVVNMQDDRCYDLIQKFIKERPADWDEDIGEEKEDEKEEGNNPEVVKGAQGQTYYQDFFG